MYIGAIHTEHYRVAMMMLKAGKHVLCEKPMTMKMSDTYTLTQYAKEHKLFLMEGVWSRCFPIYDSLKQILDANMIGDVKHVSASFGFNASHVDRLKFVIFDKDRTQR